ncbi:hypothetical protein QR680_008097 [Steinernema hermaphroditum]|uniref:Uncharacterized protein n=1 Tax=Steinernema hermaphroditum TaxID=289476 RepID=A0AA39M7H6_9BILA|nr:hypothetical protein QR680_008097 [Steinernema hermaphroditum]
MFSPNSPRSASWTVPSHRTVCKEGLLASSKPSVSVEGVIQRCKSSIPKWPSFKNMKQRLSPKKKSSESSPAKEVQTVCAVGKDCDRSHEELLAEMEKMRLELALLKKEQLNTRNLLTPPPTPSPPQTTGGRRAPPPPPPVEYLRYKPNEIQIGRKSKKSEELLTKAVKKIDMSEVLKDIGKVTLKKVGRARSPGGTPLRRPAEYHGEEPGVELMRNRFRSLRKANSPKVSTKC